MIKRLVRPFCATHRVTTTQTRTKTLLFNLPFSTLHTQHLYQQPIVHVNRRLYSTSSTPSTTPSTTVIPIEEELQQFDELYGQVDTLQEESDRHHGKGNFELCVNTTTRALQLLQQMQSKTGDVSKEAAHVVEETVVKTKIELLSLRALATMGKENKSNSDIESIHADLKEVIQLYPSAYAHHNYASFLMIQNRFTDAIEHCDKAIELEPNEPAAYLVKADSLSRLCRDIIVTADQIKQIVDCATFAIDLQYKESDAYLLRGQWIVENHMRGQLNSGGMWRLEQAISDLTKHIDTFPFGPVPFLYRAYCNHILGREKETKEDFAKCNEFNQTYNVFSEEQMKLMGEKFNSE